MSTFIPLLFTSFYNSSLSSPLKPYSYKDTLNLYKPLPDRSSQLKSLENSHLDVLVIGGGATGCGVALDAVTRGLKTGLVELDDFASGASSKSTKLIHGGVRYLQKAIFNLDIEQYKMVREALRERANLLEIAPHLSGPLPIMLPIYKWYLIPWYWLGLKCYDLVAGTKNLKWSYFVSKKQALELFPMLKKENLKGAIVYTDGYHNDSRMCLCMALTAARKGALIANHVGVTGIVKDLHDNKICAATVKDQLSGKEFTIKAKCIVNATGPHTDSILKMDDPSAKKICEPSSGVHIVLPGWYSPARMGMLDAATSDGRVVFFLPWQRYTIAGTTDRKCEPSFHPSPTEEDIQFILKEIRNYINPDIEVRRSDVLAAWSGIRPLVKDPRKENTESLARNHIVFTSKSGLVSICGGKWSNMRKMSEDAIDEVLKQNQELKNKAGPCITMGLKLEGAENWTPTLYINLVQNYGLEPEVAMNLAESYGDRAVVVAEMAQPTGKKWPKVGKRIHSELPYIEAEVRFATREYAATAVDVIARRLRISFLNCVAAEESLKTIIRIMAEELSWSKSEQKKNYDDAIEFLQQEMGLHHEVQDGHECSKGDNHKH